MGWSEEVEAGVNTKVSSAAVTVAALPLIVYAPLVGL